MTDIKAYQRDHLLQERNRLRHASPPSGIYERRLFEPTGNLSPQELGARLVEVLLVINENIEAATPTMVNCTNPAELAELDAFWRARLPHWFSEQFVKHPTDRRTKIAASPDFSGMSDKEVATYLKAVAKEDGGRDPVLVTWLISFTMDERYWFYAGHETRGGKLIVGFDQSEPTGTYSLEELIRFCGGRPAEEMPELKMPRWFSSLFRRGRGCRPKT